MPQSFKQQSCKNIFRIKTCAVQAATTQGTACTPQENKGHETQRWQVLCEEEEQRSSLVKTATNCQYM